MKARDERKKVVDLDGTYHNRDVGWGGGGGGGGGCVGACSTFQPKRVPLLGYLEHLHVFPNQDQHKPQKKHRLGLF